MLLVSISRIKKERPKSIIHTWASIDPQWIVPIIAIPLHAFFLISNFFLSNTRLKLTKNYAKADQHPEAEFLLFENYLIKQHLSNIERSIHEKVKQHCTEAEFKKSVAYKKKGVYLFITPGIPPYICFYLDHSIILFISCLVIFFKINQQRCNFVIDLIWVTKKHWYSKILNSREKSCISVI